MSEQDNQLKAKKREDVMMDLYKIHAYIPNDAEDNPLTPFGNFCAGYEVATAESDKRIAELKQRALEESNKYVAYCDLAEAKIAELESENAEYDHINIRMRDILHATANALKGEPDALTLHSWHDLPEKALELKANTSQMVQAVSRAADAREAGMENEIIALQAHINVLREALEEIAKVNHSSAKCGQIAQQALASTPAQSLQEHDNEVIERCAKVCESLKNQDYCVDVRAGAEAIRALKGK